MRTLLRRLTPGQWIYLTLSYSALELFYFGEYGQLTPKEIVFSVLIGLLAAFGFACARPWADRFDAKIRRLFSRR